MFDTQKRSPVLVDSLKRMIKDNHIDISTKHLHLCLYEGNEYKHIKTAEGVLYVGISPNIKIELFPEHMRTEPEIVESCTNIFTKRFLDQNKTMLVVTRSTLVINIFRGLCFDVEELFNSTTFTWINKDNVGYKTEFDKHMRFKNLPDGCMNTQLKILSKIITF